MDWVVEFIFNSKPGLYQCLFNHRPLTDYLITLLPDLFLIEIENCHHH